MDQCSYQWIHHRGQKEEQGKLLVQLDMRDISPVIFTANFAGVAIIICFPNRFFLWSIEMEGHITVTHLQSMHENQNFI